MVTIQEQFELACALARENEHQIIAIVCTLAQFRGLDIKLLDGEVFYHTTQVSFPNGAVVRWVNSMPKRLVDYGGYWFTTLFVADMVRGDVVLALQHRLRSPKFNGKFKTYHASGLVTWMESEVYGSR